MIEVTTVTVGFLASNCYIVRERGNTEAVLIDPGADYEKISAVLEAKGLTPKAVLLTHAHFDHCNAVSRFKADGCRVYLHNADEILLRTEMNMAGGMGARFNPFTPDVLFLDGFVIDECALTFKCVHTPGHTAGGVCYIIDNLIFSGDTLFCLSIGRSDFPTGNGRELINSVSEKLFALSGDYIVYPGHGESTTLDFERKHNPYV